MKKILITGKNSYIGGMFIEWVAQWPDKYSVDEISVHGDEWKEVGFSNYDVIFHVAAIVHKKETKNNVDLYYKVNRDLAYEVAKKAKEDGVSQFIFMSTMNVYGVSRGVITKETPCKPKTVYGKSKLEAEKLIDSLKDDSFSVVIIRPPMVYGPNAVGNYSTLSKFAKIVPFFPDINNKRSMIYIKNLNELIRMIIENNKNGVYTPQNAEYVRTSEMVRLIANVHEKKVYMTRIFNPIIKKLNLNIVNKVFGSLTYDFKISEDLEAYNKINLKQSVIQTELEK